MPTKRIRTLFPIGDGSIAVVIPIDWIRYNQLKVKDKVEVIIDEEPNVVKIKPFSKNYTN